MPIYTEIGDNGETFLYGGKKVYKSDPQVEAYGTVDELSSFIGLVFAKIKKKQERGFLLEIQKDLYRIMSYLSGKKDVNLSFLEKKVNHFEKKIDEIEKKLPRLNRFIIPSGSELCSLFHITRTICRRAEREVVRYFTTTNRQPVTSQIANQQLATKYLNRLSDLFFQLARFYNTNEIVV